LDEILEMLEKTTKKTQKLFDESEVAVAKQVDAYERILKSPAASEAEKV